MIEKLDLAEIVRYLFSSIATGIAVCLAKGIRLPEITHWIAVNSWATSTGPLTLFLLILFFAGYLAFTIYRSLVYELGLLPLKHWVGKKLGVRSYRRYLSDLAEQLGDTAIGGIQAERVYAVVKFEDLKEFYRESGSRITTGIHFLLCCGLVILIATLFRLHDLWPATLACVAALALVFVADWHFEQLELLVFHSNEDKVRARVQKLVSRIPTGTRQTPKSPS